MYRHLLHLTGRNHHAAHFILLGEPHGVRGRHPLGGGILGHGKVCRGGGLTPS